MWMLRLMKGLTKQRMALFTGCFDHLQAEGSKTHVCDPSCAWRTRLLLDAYDAHEGDGTAATAAAPSTTTPSRAKSSQPPANKHAPIVRYTRARLANWEDIPEGAETAGRYPGRRLLMTIDHEDIYDILGSKVNKQAVAKHQQFTRAHTHSPNMYTLADR